MCKQPSLAVLSPSFSLWLSANRELENTAANGGASEAWRALFEILTEEPVTRAPTTYHTTAQQYGGGTAPQHGIAAAVILGYRPRRSAAAARWRSEYREAAGDAYASETESDE